MDALDQKACPGDCRVLASADGPTVLWVQEKRDTVIENLNEKTEENAQCEAQVGASLAEEPMRGCMHFVSACISVRVTGRHACLLPMPCASLTPWC